MKNKKISIIISTLNTEKYVEKCLKSIQNQNYKNLEIIIIDDYSTDNTWKIVEKIAKKDKRMIIRKNEKLQGLAHNRNIGLELSTGEYIGFIDSDDYIAEDYYEKMVQKLENEKADICICDMNVIYENTGVSTKVPCGGKNKVDFINNGLAASCCNKLFKKEIIKYQFSDGKLNEDLAVIFPALIEAKKIAYEDSVSYNYVQRNNSLQNAKISDKRFDIFYGVDLTLERIKDCQDYKEISETIQVKS